MAYAYIPGPMSKEEYRYRLAKTKRREPYVKFFKKVALVLWYVAYGTFVLWYLGFI